MSESVAVHTTQRDVRRRLAELGLDEALLIEAAQTGFGAMAACTGNHPSGAPGYFAWAETVRALRDRLVPKGWERRNDSNLPLIVNEAGTIALSVSTGDRFTGRADANPSTNSPKGNKTARQVRANRYMEYLFPEMASVPVDQDLGPTTWILLFHCDIKEYEFRLELSQPIDMNMDGYVDQWGERIILTSTRFDGVVVEPAGGGQTPEIRIEIKRRA